MNFTEKALEAYTAVNGQKKELQVAFLSLALEESFVSGQMDEIKKRLEEKNGLRN